MAGRESDKTRERALDGLLRHTLRQADPPVGACPGPEILAAYFERSLDDREIAEYESHLSGCARCREQLAALTLASAPPRYTESEKPRWAWLWDWRWLAPVTAVLVIAAVWYARRPEMTAEKHPQLAYVARSESAEPPVGETAPRVFENNVTPAPVTPKASSGDAAEKAEGRESYLPSAPPPAPAEKENPSDRKAADEFASNVETNALKKDSAAQSISGGTAAGAVGGTVAGGVVGGANEPRAAAAKTRQVPAPALYGRNTNAVILGQISAQTLVRTPNPKVFWRLSAGGFVERSTDSGATWMGQVPSAGAQLTAGSAPAENICWLVGHDGAVLVTTNAADWKTISPPAQADFVGIVAKDAFAATVSAADGRKFTTKDGGESWQLEPQAP